MHKCGFQTQICYVQFDTYQTQEMLTMKRPENLTPQELYQFLNYNPETGKLVWRKTVSRWNKRGNIAGRVNNSRGELEVRLKGHWYKAHHIAWFFITGLWPRTPIGHKNKVGNDNRAENLYERWSVPEE